MPHRDANLHEKEPLTIHIPGTGKVARIEYEIGVHDQLILKVTHSKETVLKTFTKKDL